MPATGDITQVQLPNGDVYNIKDVNVENIGIDSTYNATDQQVILTVGSLNDADSTEY